MLLRVLVAAVTLALAPAMGRAQGVLQSLGPMVSGHAVMAYDSGSLMDAGGPLANGSPPLNSINPGTMPLGYAWVNSGLGDCGFSAYANAAFHTSCWGFDGSGNGLWSYDGGTIAKATSAGFQFFGSPTATTAAVNDNSTRIASTAWVNSFVGGLANTQVTWEPTNSGLASLSTAGVNRALRGGVSALGDAPGALFTASSSTCAALGYANDKGNCVTSFDNLAWLNIQSTIDCTQFGVPAHGIDGTAPAQACVDAAYTLGIKSPGAGPAVAYFPRAFDFAGALYTYPGVRIVCSSPSVINHRTAVGSGLTLADQPGHTYVAAQTSATKNGSGPWIENCSVDGGGHDGTNLMLDSALSWHLVNSSFTNSGSNGSQGIASAAGTTLTVASVSIGAIKGGDILFCANCRAANNGFVTVQPYGTGGTTGVGGAGTYSLSSALTFASGNYFATASSWNWTAGDGTTLLPSANIALMGQGTVGGVFNGDMLRVFAGGTSTGSGCSTYSPIGILADTTSPTGSQKFNQNELRTVYAPCNALGVAYNNAADNLIDGIDYEFTGIAQLNGMGEAGVQRLKINRPYFEGGAVGIVNDTNTNGVQVYNTGSLGGISRTMVDYGSFNSFEYDNHLTYHHQPIIDDFNLADLNPGSFAPAVFITSQGGSRTVVGSTAGDVELAVQSVGAGNVAHLNCGHINNTTQLPTTVQNGDVLCSMGPYGQGDSVFGDMMAGGGIDFVAGSQWAFGSNAESITKFYTVAHNAAVRSLALTLGSDQSAAFGSAAALAGNGNVGVNLLHIGHGVFGTLPACGAGTEGTLAVVTNSSTVTWGATADGAGANPVLAWCNLSNWTVVGK